MNRSRLFRMGRLVISAGIIGLLVWRLDLGEVWGHLSGLSWPPLVLVALLQLVMIGANALRWQIMLRAKGIGSPLPRLFYYYLVGIFFSSFLPTSVGGDFARVVAVASSTGRRADAFASVAVERLLGFFVLLPVGLAAVPFVWQDLVEWRLAVTVGILATAIFVGLYIILLRPVARWLSVVLSPLLGMLERFKARERLEKAYRAVAGYRDCKKEIFMGLVISVVSRLLWVLSCYLIARELGIDVTFAAMLLVVPIVELVRMVPVSISGIGVREAAFVVMLRQFGVEDSLGFALSVVVYVIFFGWAVVGGVLYGTRQFVGRA